LYEIAALAPTFRDAVLVASRYPEAFVAIDRAQVRATTALELRIETLDLADQDRLWRLLEQPALIEEVVEGGPKTLTELSAIASRAIPSLRDPVRVMGTTHFRLLQEVRAIGAAAELAFEAALGGLPEDARAAFERLRDDPPLLAWLAGEPTELVALGQQDPERARALLAALAALTVEAAPAPRGVPAVEAAAPRAAPVDVVIQESVVVYPVATPYLYGLGRPRPLVTVSPWWGASPTFVFNTGRRDYRGHWKGRGGRPHYQRGARRHRGDSGPRLRRGPARRDGPDRPRRANTGERGRAERSFRRAGPARSGPEPPARLEVRGSEAPRRGQAERRRLSGPPAASRVRPAAVPGRLGVTQSRGSRAGRDRGLERRGRRLERLAPVRRVERVSSPRRAAAAGPERRGPQGRVALGRASARAETGASTTARRGRLVSERREQSRSARAEGQRVRRADVPRARGDARPARSRAKRNGKAKRGKATFQRVQPRKRRERR
jgi:hypothetical protein